MKLADLTPDKRNANKGTHRGRKMIAESLRDYGAGRSILIDRDGNIIAGNKTAEGAKVAGIDEVQIVESDGTKLIAVKRTDLQIDSAEARALAIADNRASEVSLDWDLDVLKGLETEVDVEKFWTHVEFDALVGRESNTDAPEPQLDKAAELQEKWKTERGQIWEIGRHRLMCGDSTTDLSVLMGGRKARLLVTDPPYNVGIFGGMHNPRDAKNYKMGKWTGPSSLQNDLLSDGDFGEFLLALLSAAKQVMAPGAAFYVCSPPGCTETQFRNVIDQVFVLRQCIVWVKQQFVFGRQDYHWRHESILYGWNDGAAHYFTPDKTQDTVWQVDRPMTSDKEHPTVKPLELFAKAMRNSSEPGDLVLDVCSGAGTTLCASQAIGRTCYAMEIEPKYVAVALERLAAMGLTPKLAMPGAVAQQTSAPDPVVPAARTKRPRAARIATVA